MKTVLLSTVIHTIVIETRSYWAAPIPRQRCHRCKQQLPKMIASLRSHPVQENYSNFGTTAWLIQITADDTTITNNAWRLSSTTIYTWTRLLGYVINAAKVPVMILTLFLRSGTLAENLWYQELTHHYSLLLTALVDQNSPWLEH